MKSLVAFEFIVQLLLIDSLKPLKIKCDCNYFIELGSCIQLHPEIDKVRLVFMLTLLKGEDKVSSLDIRISPSSLMTTETGVILRQVLFAVQSECSNLA